eukprot:437069-Alexandrium_andersonii.AAC.1
MRAAPRTPSGLRWELTKGALCPRPSSLLASPEPWPAPIRACGVCTTAPGSSRTWTMLSWSPLPTSPRRPTTSFARRWHVLA